MRNKYTYLSDEGSSKDETVTVHEYKWKRSGKRSRGEDGGIDHWIA